MPDLEVPVMTRVGPGGSGGGGELVEVEVWKDTCRARDQGNTVASWIRAFLDMVTFLFFVFVGGKGVIFGLWFWFVEVWMDLVAVFCFSVAWSGQLFTVITVGLQCTCFFFFSRRERKREGEIPVFAHACTCM